MDATQRERLGELFERAVERAGAGRSLYIDTACDDVEVRSELRSLLDSHDEAPSFLKGEPAAVVARALESLATAPAGPFDRELSRRYQILERLGGGGMGVVYKAQDLRLGRAVALKFLAPYLTADSTARDRMLMEARAASVLDHPNIAVIHEIDETESGQLYISMACYPGDTLRDRLNSGPLAVDAATDVARQIAEAVAAAHAAGIVHRDIKPSNVLITSDDVVKLVDFGISIREGAELPDDSRLLGTVAYMSPEQTRGEFVDRRSDLWSIGVVLYELLTGHQPFRGAGVRATLRAIREATPAPLEEACPSAPAAVAHIVDTCLRKERSERYQSGEELVSALRHVPPVSDLPTGVTGLGGPHPVAVLPFRGHGLPPELDHLTEALAHDLIARLSVVRGLRVSSWASARTYASGHAGHRAIAEELGVRYLVTGELSAAAGAIQLSVSCLDGQSLASRWSHQADMRLDDIPRVQAGIAERIVAAADAVATDHQLARLQARGARNPDAYARYLAGLRLLDARVEPAAREALRHFQALTAAEPESAHAWCGLAQAHQLLAGLLATPPDEAYPLAGEAAERALALDDELADAHGALALNLSYYHLDLAAAEQHFRRAIELAPSYSEARGFYGELLRNQGRFDEALTEVRAAQVLNPHSPAHELEEGIILYVARRYEQALDRYEQLRTTSPGFQMVHFFIALVQAQLGRYEEALESLQILDPQQALPDTRSLRGYVCAMSGRSREARELIVSLEASLAAPSHALDPSPFHVAIIHVALGEHAEALERLWEAFRQRTWQTALLGVEPMVDPLRGEQRFQALLEAMGLHRTPPAVTPIARPR